MTPIWSFQREFCAFPWTPMVRIRSRLCTSREAMPEIWHTQLSIHVSERWKSDGRDKGDILYNDDLADVSGRCRVRFRVCVG